MIKKPLKNRKTTIYFTSHHKLQLFKKYPYIIYVKNCLECEFWRLYLNKTKSIDTKKPWHWNQVYEASILLPVDISKNFYENNVFLKGYNKSCLRIKSRESETATQMCFVKKMFLKILQNSEKNTFARISFLIKLQA